MSIPQLLTDPEFQNAMVTMYNTCSKSTHGDIYYAKQVDYLKKQMMDTPRIASATTLSVMTAMLDLAYHCLSIEPISKAEAYITPRSHNLGTKDKPQWQQRVILQISAYGELKLRIRSGIVKYANNPVMVYKGDDFKVVNGVVQHTSRHESDEITHAWIMITRHDNSVEYKHFSIGEILSFKAKADEQQQKSHAWTGGVNGQPTPGMIAAKVIKHSFSTYPRLFLGKSAVLQTDEIDREAFYATTMAGIMGGEQDVNQQDPQDPIDQHFDDDIAQNQSGDITQVAQDAVEALSEQPEQKQGSVPSFDF